MAGYQEVLNKYNDIVIEDYIRTNQQQFNGAKSAEALILLQLIHYLLTIMIGMTLGSIIVLTGQKLVAKGVNSDMIKSSQGAVERSSLIFEIKCLLKLIPISMKIKYAPKPKQPTTFEQDSEVTLLNDSNQKAKQLLQ